MNIRLQLVEVSKNDLFSPNMYLMSLMEIPRYCEARQRSISF